MFIVLHVYKLIVMGGIPKMKLMPSLNRKT